MKTNRILIPILLSACIAGTTGCESPVQKVMEYIFMGYVIHQEVDTQKESAEKAKEMQDAYLKAAEESKARREAEIAKSIAEIEERSARIHKQAEDESNLTNQERIHRQFREFEQAMFKYNMTQRTEYHTSQPCPDTPQDLAEKDESKKWFNAFDPDKKDPWGNDYIYTLKEQKKNTRLPYDKEYCISVKLLDDSTEEKCVMCESTEHAMKNKEAVDKKKEANKRKYGD